MIILAKEKTYITSKEAEIMKVLWNSERPLLISDISALTQNIAENSLQPMVGSLIKKGYIKVVGNMKVAKTYSRLYAPALTVDEYAAQQLSSIFKDTGKSMNISNVLTYLLKYNKKKENKNFINELKEFIDNYKEKK